MALTVIKSVRIRGKEKTKKDGRLSLKTDGTDRSIIVYLSDTDNPYYSEFTPTTFTKKNWKEKSDDDIINFYLTNPNSGHPGWSVVQDPFDPKVIPDNPGKKVLKTVRVRCSKSDGSATSPGDLDGKFVLEADDEYYYSKMYYLGALPEEGLNSSYVDIGATGPGGSVQNFLRWDSAMVPFDKEKKFFEENYKVKAGRETEIINLIIRSSINMSDKYKNWKIIQDPFNLDVIPPDDEFNKRVYGHDLYYLNNGGAVRIEWYDETGMTHSLEDIASVKEKKISVRSPILKEPDFSIDGGPLDNKFTPVELTTNFGKKIKFIPYEFSENGFKYSKDVDSPGNSKKNPRKIFSNQKDGDLLGYIISALKVEMSNFQGIDIGVNKLDFCKPDSDSCSIVKFSGYFEQESLPVDQTVDNLFPTDGSTASAYVKDTPLTILGIQEGLTVKANTDLPEIEVYCGKLPPEGGDDFNNLAELDPEYVEDIYRGEEVKVVSGGELIVSKEEIKEQQKLAETNSTLSNDAVTNNCVGGGTGLVSTGTYTSELPNESFKGSGSIKPGFNGVPYYQQFDARWGNVIYGKAKDGTFVEAKITNPGVGNIAKVSWNGGTYDILCDFFYGNAGWSTIHGGGCGITSTSMIITYWATKGKCKPTSPVKIAKLACENGARPGPVKCNGTQPGGSMFKAIKQTFGLNMSSITKDTAKKNVEKGYPVLFCGINFTGLNSGGKTSHTYPGHFIVLTGKDGDKWRVNDPGSNPDVGGITHFNDFPNGSYWQILPEGV